MWKSKWQEIGKLRLPSGVCWLGVSGVKFHDGSWEDLRDKLLANRQHTMESSAGGSNNLAVVLPDGFQEREYPVEVRVTENCEVAELRITFLP